MSYVIRSFDESFGQITVEYNGVNFSIDLPIDENNNYPTGDKLTEIIDNAAPKWHTARKEKIAAGVNNSDVIKAMVVPVVVPEPTPEEVAAKEAQIALQSVVGSLTNLETFVVNIVDQKLGN